MALNERQKCFVVEYIKYGNATKAAQNAGYSSETAYSQGWRLLQNLEVQAEITKYQKKSAKKANVTLDSTISELNRVLDIALTTDKPSAAISAIMAKAKLAGLLDGDRTEDDNTPFEVVVRK